MTNQISRDLTRRSLVAKYEIKRIKYKAISQDINLPYSLRSMFALKLALLPRNSSKTRIRNRCIVTGRARSVYKKFRVSRIVFRELALQGAISGIQKSSW
jgi:ribosomal protein S14